MAETPIVTPTIMDGTVVRWYRSYADWYLFSHELRPVAPSRDGIAR